MAYMVNWRYNNGYAVDPNKSFIDLMCEQVGWEKVDGLMRADLATQYQMMGLQGYKRCERYFARAEMEESYMLARFIVDHLDVSPVVSITYETPPMGSNIKDLMDCKMAYATENLLRLKVLMERAISEQRETCFPIIECLLNKQEEHIVKIKRCLKELNFVAYDKAYIMEHSEWLHCKMKRKEKKIGYKIK